MGPTETFGTNACGVKMGPTETFGTNACYVKMGPTETFGACYSSIYITSLCIYRLCLWGSRILSCCNDGLFLLPYIMAW